MVTGVFDLGTWCFVLGAWCFEPSCPFRLLFLPSAPAPAFAVATLRAGSLAPAERTLRGLCRHSLRHTTLDRWQSTMIVRNSHSPDRPPLQYLPSLGQLLP